MIDLETNGTDREPSVMMELDEAYQMELVRMETELEARRIIMRLEQIRGEPWTVWSDEKGWTDQRDAQMASWALNVLRLTEYMRNHTQAKAEENGLRQILQAITAELPEADRENIALSVRKLVEKTKHTSSVSRGGTGADQSGNQHFLWTDDARSILKALHDWKTVHLNGTKWRLVEEAEYRDLRNALKEQEERENTSTPDLKEWRHILQQIGGAKDYRDAIALLAVLHEKARRNGSNELIKLKNCETIVVNGEPHRLISQAHHDEFKMFWNDLRELHKKLGVENTHDALRIIRELQTEHFRLHRMGIGEAVEMDDGLKYRMELAENIEDMKLAHETAILRLTALYKLLPVPKGRAHTVGNSDDRQREAESSIDRLFSTVSAWRDWLKRCGWEGTFHKNNNGIFCVDSDGEKPVINNGAVFREALSYIGRLMEIGQI